MADPNLAGMSRRSSRSLRPGRYWMSVLDGARLREARTERGLTREKLAADAGVSVSTMARLEGQRAATCHRATLYRIAAKLADDPERVISALTVQDGATEARNRPEHDGFSSSWQCSRVFLAVPEQVKCARDFLGRVLHGCPMAHEARIICSELFTNSVQHSGSARPGGTVTVRAQVREHDYLWLEVEDEGGPWGGDGKTGDGGRGLGLVAGLSDYWDIRWDEGRRLVCARIDWPEPQILAMRGHVSGEIT